MKKVVTEVSSRVFSLPYLVAQDEGLFAAEGLEVRLVPKTRPKSVSPVDDHRLVSPFGLRSSFEDRQASLYRACEWGQIRRSWDSRRGGQVVSKRAAVVSQAILVRPDSPATCPQDLSERTVGVNFHHGSHYTAIQMLEGFLRRDEIRVVHVDGPFERFQALRDGVVDAANLMEPWITAGEKLGYKVISETFYAGSEIASPDLDAETYASIKRAITKAVRKLNEDPRPFLHHLIAEVPPEVTQLSESDFRLERLRYVEPVPYTEEEFERAYEWMLSWGLIEPQARFERLVDNRLTA